MATSTIIKPARPAAQRVTAQYALLAAATVEYDPSRALALVALSCAGVAVSDLVRLDMRSVPDLGAAGRVGYHITTRAGLQVPISADTFSLVIDYLCKTGRLGDPGHLPLFLSRRQHRLSTKQVRRILASVASRAGIDITNQ